MSRDEEIATLRAAISATEDQLCAAFAEQIRIAEEIAAIYARIEKLITEAVT